ncbi:MAG: acyl-CoA dehydrogenase family protein [Deltaproteobacteria bacterium]|nr:acyl-CoA dehydrogenase family protein [Deltaproteobacteria bacterium]
MKRYGNFIGEESKALLQSVRNFVDKEIMPVRLELDESREACEEVIAKLVDLGMQKYGLSPKYGGVPIGSAAEYCAVCEELARGDSGIATEMTCPEWLFGPAMRARNKAVVEKFMAPFCSDERHTACLALTEPGGGCNGEDPTQHGMTLRTTAKLDGDEWVINGAKRWPGGASVAEIYGVLCTTDPELGEEGVALIYVPDGLPGLSFGIPENKLGMRYTDINADIFFDNVRVPKEYRVAGPGEDWKLFRAALSWGRLSSAAFSIGNAQAVLEIVIDYTSNRFYKGKSVREHSLQAAMIADMAMGIESARAYYLSVASMFDNRKEFGDPGDTYLMGKGTGAKVYACDVTEVVCNRAIELMGAYGYIKEYHVEKYLRDSKIIQLWEGGGQLGRLDVAQSYYPIA